MSSEFYLALLIFPFIYLLPLLAQSSVQFCFCFFLHSIKEAFRYSNFSIDTIFCLPFCFVCSKSPLIIISCFTYLTPLLFYFFGSNSLKLVNPFAQNCPIKMKRRKYKLETLESAPCTCHRKLTQFSSTVFSIRFLICLIYCDINLCFINQSNPVRFTFL